MSNNVPDETLDEGYFQQYQDDSYCRGWDAQARKLGNRRAVVLPPVPGCTDQFFRGQSLVLRIMRILGGSNDNV